MPFTFTMPKLSPTMETGTVAKWHKKEGDFVESGDLLLEVATDKATVEHCALDAGYIRKIIKQEGDRARVNEPLAVFTESITESLDGYIPEGVVTHNNEIASTTPPAPVTTVKSAPSREPVSAKPSSRPLASPLAKRLAKEQSLDLSHVSGSGPQGRIMSRDLADAPHIAVHTAEAVQHIADREEALSPMRQVIAERLQYSKSTIPHFYIHQQVNVDDLVQMREHVKKLEKAFTINDFIIKAVALALSMHPAVNSGYNPENNTIVRYGNIDLAIAVTIPGGLITPIVPKANTLSLSSISEKVKSLAQKAKEGKLQPAEFQGGSFTISNLGMFGISDFQAIVNPPQGAILAIGAVQEVPVVKKGEVTVGKQLSLTLSCDHRVIDGSDAAQFMQTLKRLIENPILFLTA